MYQVSEAYLEQMMHHGTRRRLSGIIGSVSFTGDDIVKDSFNISGRATEESNTKLGGVYLGQFELTFVPSFLNKVARDQYKDKEISINIGLFIPGDNNNSGEWVDIPVGVFTLQAPKISKLGISVSGYDHMKKLDKKFNIDQASATPYSYLSYMASECNVTLGQTQEEIESFPNGTEILPLDEENDIETWRDFLYWLAQACGCFACADKQGNIVIRKLGMSNNIALDEDHRDADVIFSGYTTKWTGVSFINIKDKTTSYYGLEIDDGLTMNLGSNPFLQLGTSEAVERRRRAVLTAVSQIQYTPFYCNSARDPIFDLGDELPFSGGLSGNCTGCIMAYSYSLTNYNFEGYGDDPDLADARSKTDKNIAGLLQNTVENEVTYYNFANLEALSFGPEIEIPIAKLAFTSAQETTVKIMHEFIFDMVADLSNTNSYEIRYYLDNELIGYKPYESLSPLLVSTDIPTPEPEPDPPEEEVEAEDEETVVTYNADIQPVEVSITRDFFYILKNVAPNIRHLWEVKIIAHGITSVGIQVDHAHITLEGQRLYASDYWDGNLDLKDDFRLIPFGRMSLVSITDSCTIEFSDVLLEELSDTMELIDMNTMQVMPITDSIQILMEFRHFVTQDGNTLMTQDGKRILMNG